MAQIESTNRLGSVFEVSGHWVHPQNPDSVQKQDHERGSSGNFSMTVVAQTPQKAIESVVASIVDKDIRVLRVELLA